MAPTNYRLYANLYSLCSLMVRTTIAIRGDARDRDCEMLIEEEEVDIYREEQLTEHYLCDINPLGQVPVLTSSALPEPIADSLEITHYLAERYPSLIPASHSDQITDLLAELHALNYFSLSFPDRPAMALGFKTSIEKKLAGDPSPRYRKALEYKLSIVERDKIGGIKAGVSEKNGQQAIELIEKLESYITWPPSQGETAQSWLFDLPHATALDVHLVAFVARMVDVGRESLFPPKLRSYANRVMETKDWKDVMQGRTTMTPMAK